MATRNQAAYLRQAMESVFAQTLPAGQIEFIVVNDGSTDETSRILDECEEPFIRIERDNRGLARSCNEALERAKGRYVARLDSDDLATEDWLASLIPALDSHPEAVCAIPDRYELRGQIRTLVEIDLENIYTFEACGTLFLTSALRAVGGYHLFFWEEYDLYLRLKDRGRFHRVALPLYTYRKHPGGLTQDATRREKGWEELAGAWGWDVLRSAGTSVELERSFQRAA